MKYRFPLDYIYVTQGFGVNEPDYKTVGLGHPGVDLRGPQGTTIYSVAPGRVKRVNYDAPGYGWYALIDHGEEAFESLYAHMMEAPAVSQGQQVNLGTILGKTGSTGNSSAAHLHFETRLTNGKGNYLSLPGNAVGYVDPLLFIMRHNREYVLNPTTPEIDSPPSTVGRAKGLDISRYQAVNFEWKNLRSAGYSFVFIRGTLGADYIDPWFERHVVPATVAGLHTGIYHVIIASHNPALQVANILKCLRSPTTGELRYPALPVALDVERSDGKTPAEVAENILAVAKGIEDSGLRRPIIYTGAWFWNPQVQRRSEWRNYDLWVANYVSGANPTSLPVDWRTWKFWQFTSSGRVPGYNADIDQNWFNGTEKDLQVYVAGVMQRVGEIFLPVTYA